MNGKLSAFITVSAKCPICSRESKHRYVKSKLYTPLEMEADQHVVKYKWESPEYESIRPNYYHIWHCPYCHFCDEKEVFRGEDTCGGKLEMIQEKILIAQRAPQSILARLGSVIDLNQEPLPLETALTAHILAIYIQEMLTPNMRQYAKLGRFYLRTAWLYREKATLGLPEQRVPAGFPSYRAFYESLQKDWPEIPIEESAAIRKAIAGYRWELDRAGTKETDIRQEINTFFLLCDLYMRVQEEDNALQCVRHIFQECSQRRNASRKILDNGVRDGKLTGKQIESLRSLINWLNNAIERATELSDKINQIIFTKEYPRAREKILTLTNPTVKEVVECLRAEKFHEVTCRRIVALFTKKAAEKGGSPPPTSDMISETIPSKDETSLPKEEKPSGGFWSGLLGRLTSENE